MNTVSSLNGLPAARKHHHCLAQHCFGVGLCFESVCHQKAFVRNIHLHMDAGTQVLDSRPFVAGIETIAGKHISRQCELDPALKDIIFQFVFRQSVMHAAPKEFYSALKTLPTAHGA